MDNLKGSSFEHLQTERASKMKLMNGIFSAFKEEYAPLAVRNLCNSMECLYQEILLIDEELRVRGVVKTILSSSN